MYFTTSSDNLSTAYCAKKGDIVKITEGPFEGYEGTIDDVDPEKGLVRVLVTIFGRQAPVEIEYWMVEKGDAT